MVDDNYNTNKSKNEWLVLKFPFKELPSVSPSNLIQVRKCLPILLEISQLDLFYTNIKAVRYTLEFATTILSNFDNIYAKDIFVELLILLKEILVRYDKLEDDFPYTNLFLDMLLYISDLDIFCNYCSNICQSILQQLLKWNKSYCAPLDDTLAGIMENLKNIKADKEVAALSEVVLRKFPLESKSFKLSAYWLLFDSMKILKDLRVEHIEEKSEIPLIIRNINMFFVKVRGSLSSHSKMAQYHENVMQFVNDLMDISPKLIKLSCTKSTGPEARQLLGFVLFEFLKEQGIISHDIEIVINEEIYQLPKNFKDWPKHFSVTFFWISHLLYYRKRSVWTSAEVCDAIYRLIYTKKYKKVLNVAVLKSISYIYPKTLQGYSKIRKKRMLGDDLINSVLPPFIPLLNKILSISRSQIFWILYKGSKKIKMSTLKFWLDTKSKENLCTLKEALAITNSEHLLIDILKLRSCDLKDSMVHNAIEVIQDLRSNGLLKQIIDLIPKFRGDLTKVGALIQACCHEIPQDKKIATKLFDNFYIILQMNPNDDLLINMCRYAGKMVTSLKNDSDFIYSISTDSLWIRHLISRINGDNDILIVAILEILIQMLKYQKKPCCTTELIFIDFAPLLLKSKKVIAKALTFLSQLLLRIRITPIKLEEETIFTIFYRLYDFIDESYPAAKVYGCLTSLLKLYPSQVLHSNILGMQIEDWCHCSNMKNYSPALLRFVQLWIKLMYDNPNKHVFYLPQEGLITLYIKRSMRQVSTVKRHLYFISEIYNVDEYDSDDEDELTFNLNCWVSRECTSSKLLRKDWISHLVSLGLLKGPKITL